MTEYMQSIRGGTDSVVRRYEYDDTVVLAADFGPVEGSVDVVDGTAMVVVDDEQYEFDVPEGAVRTVMNNGVVTVEVER